MTPNHKYTYLHTLDTLTESIKYNDCQLWSLLEIQRKKQTYIIPTLLCFAYIFLHCCHNLNIYFVFYTFFIRQFIEDQRWRHFYQKILLHQKWLQHITSHVIKIESSLMVMTVNCSLRTCFEHFLLLNISLFFYLALLASDFCSFASWCVIEFGMSLNLGGCQTGITTHVHLRLPVSTFFSFLSFQVSYCSFTVDFWFLNQISYDISWEHLKCHTWFLSFS